MAGKQRTLTAAEQRRLAAFAGRREELQAQGYSCREKRYKPLFVNVMAIIIMLPYAILMAVFFWLLPGHGDLESLRFRNYFPSYAVFLCTIFALALALAAVHELIHGICFSRFSPDGWKSVQFGFHTTALAPYCACLVPLRKGGYIISALMPTIVLGFLPCIAASLLGNSFVFTLGVLMLFGGGGDFLMVYGMLAVRTKGKDVLFIDHPTELGFFVFERGQAEEA